MNIFRIDAIVTTGPEAIKLTHSTHTSPLRLITLYNNSIKDPDQPARLQDDVRISSMWRGMVAVPVLAIFGSLKRGKTFNHSNVRGDIRGAWILLMNVMYCIECEYLQADISYMIPDIAWPPRKVMKFDPIVIVYHRWWGLLCFHHYGHRSLSSNIRQEGRFERHISRHPRTHFRFHGVQSSDDAQSSSESCRHCE